MVVCAAKKTSNQLQIEQIHLQREKNDLCLDKLKSLPPDEVYISNQCLYNFGLIS